MNHRTLTLGTLLLLAACSPNDNTAPVPKLFKEQRDVLDKAQAVDAVVQRQNEEQRKSTEKQTE